MPGCAQRECLGLSPVLKDVLTWTIKTNSLIY